MGQDIDNGAVWEIQYVEGQGFSLKNIGTGLYKGFGTGTANAEEAAYWSFKQVIVDFEQSGLGKINESEKLLDDTRAELMAGGVPVFKEPEMVEAVLPDAPEYQKIDNTYSTGTDEKTKKKNEELDKLKAMADSIGGNGAKADKADKAEDAGAIDLASLAKQAAAIDGKKSQPSKKEDKPAKDGGLGDLLKQAKSIK